MSVESISMLLNKVLSNSNSYPSRIINTAKKFQNDRVESAESLREIRANYYDIWQEYKNRPLAKAHQFSIGLNNKYGREQMRKFHELLSRARVRKDYFRFVAHQFRQEVKLAESNPKDLGAVFEFVQHVNAGKGLPEGDDWAWFNSIPEHASVEILLWKLINGEQR